MTSILDFDDDDCKEEVISGKPPGLHPVARKFALESIPLMMHSLANQAGHSSCSRNSQQGRDRVNAQTSIGWLKIFLTMNRIQNGTI